MNTCWKCGSPTNDDSIEHNYNCRKVIQTSNPVGPSAPPAPSVPPAQPAPSYPSQYVPEGGLPQEEAILQFKAMGAREIDWMKIREMDELVEVLRILEVRSFLAPRHPLFPVLKCYFKDE